MDWSFYFQEGQQLFAKNDAVSVKKALEHFKKANEMIDEDSIAKPKVLGYLALGNFIIGQIEQSYRIAHKARRRLDTVLENSALIIDNMRQRLGGEDLDILINHIAKEFPQIVAFIDTEDDDFDENILDFSLLDYSSEIEKKGNIRPQFSVDDLGDNLLMATFEGLSKDNDEVIYFDKLKGDVLFRVRGSYVSLLTDRSLQGKELMEKIMSSEQRDFTDDDRYILIDQLKLSDFLKEYKKQTDGKEPFLSFVDYFSIDILTNFTYNKDLFIENVLMNSAIKKRFHELFSQKYQNRIFELRSDFLRIFENTAKTLAINWIKQNIFTNSIVDDSSGALDLNDWVW
jgi:hypothetical protein